MATKKATQRKRTARKSLAQKIQNGGKKIKVQGEPDAELVKIGPLPDIGPMSPELAEAQRIYYENRRREAGVTLKHAEAFESNKQALRNYIAVVIPRAKEEVFTSVCQMFSAGDKFAEDGVFDFLYGVRHLKTFLLRPKPTSCCKGCAVSMRSMTY
jgi:hypothetical protein